MNAHPDAQISNSFDAERQWHRSAHAPSSSHGHVFRIGT